MPNPPEPDRGAAPQRPSDERVGGPGEQETEVHPLVPSDAETVVISRSGPEGDPEATSESQQRERRFTAPGFDAKETQGIRTPAEPETEVFGSPPKPEGPPATSAPPKTAVPQSIPPRLG